MEKLKKCVEEKTWNEFRKTGLFMFVNTILHAFGWVIVVKIEGDQVKCCYPARTKFRGFSESDQEEMHTKIANYLAEASENFPDEIK